MLFFTAGSRSLGSASKLTGRSPRHRLRGNVPLSTTRDTPTPIPGLKVPRFGNFPELTKHRVPAENIPLHAIPLPAKRAGIVQIPTQAPRKGGSGRQSCGITVLCGEGLYEPRSK